MLDPAHYWGDATPVLSARLEHAAELYREGVAPVVIVTGPRRNAGIERYALMSHGVPAQDIVAFSTGTDTVGALQLLPEPADLAGIGGDLRAAELGLEVVVLRGDLGQLGVEVAHAMAGGSSASAAVAASRSRKSATTMSRCPR